jgi:hypothetical protein
MTKKRGLLHIYKMPKEHYKKGTIHPNDITFAIRELQSVDFLFLKKYK